MKRLRLLIYDDTPQGMEKTRLMESVKGTVRHGQCTITSIELNPLRITILELLRLFRREATR